MRILVLTGNAYFDDPSFSKSKSGLGYAVSSMCEQLAKDNEVFLLTQSGFTNAKVLNGVKILRKRWIDVFSGFSLKYIRKWFIDTRTISFLSDIKLRTFAYYLTGKYAEKQIKKLRPDIVSICELNHSSASFLFACTLQNVPFTISMHGLSTFNEELNADRYMLKLERNFLDSIEQYNVSVVSTGIKRRIEAYKKKECSNIYVIPNGVSPFTSCDYFNRNIFRESLSIPADSFVLISVATVNRNKNQIQVLETIARLDKKKRDKLFYIICGKGDYEEEISKRAKELNIEDKIIMCGYIPHKEIWKYYQTADLNLLVSHSDGFGLSVIEGYMNGIPSLMYADLDATPDLFNEKTSIIVDERTDYSLMKGIEEAYNRTWEPRTIKEFGLRFTERKMGEAYEDFLSKVLLKEELKRKRG